MSNVQMKRDPDGTLRVALGGGNMPNDLPDDAFHTRQEYEEQADEILAMSRVSKGITASMVSRVYAKFNGPARHVPVVPPEAEPVGAIGLDVDAIYANYNRPAPAPKPDRADVAAQAAVEGVGGAGLSDPADVYARYNSQASQGL